MDTTTTTHGSGNLVLRRFGDCARAGEKYHSGMREGRKFFASAWFALTNEERWLVAGILGLALLGLTARYLHLRGQRADPIVPPGLTEPSPAGAHE